MILVILARSPGTATSCRVIQLDYSIHVFLENPYRSSVDGINCVNGEEIASMCEVSLISSSSPSCGIPGQRTTVNEASLKS